MGKKIDVLFSREARRTGQALGYSPYMQSVHVDGAAHLANRMATIEIVDATGSSLSGRLVEVPAGDSVSVKPKSTRANRYTVPVASPQMLRDICGPAHSHLQLVEQAFADDGVRVDSQARAARSSSPAMAKAQSWPPTRCRLSRAVSANGAEATSAELEAAITITIASRA